MWFFLIIFFIINSEFIKSQSLRSYILFREEDDLEVLIAINDNAEAQIKPFMSLGDYINNCDVINDPTVTKFRTSRNLRFQLLTAHVDIVEKIVKVEKCFNGSEWIPSNDRRQCSVFVDRVRIKPIENLNFEEIILINCLTPDSSYLHEIQIMEYPRYQIAPYPSNVLRQLRQISNVYVPFDSMIECIGMKHSRSQILWQAVKTLPNWDFTSNVISPMLQVSIGQGVIPEIRPEIEEFNFQYNCIAQENSGSNTIVIPFTFRLQVIYRVEIMDQRGDKTRKYYDAGDTLECFVNANPFVDPANEMWLEPDVYIGIYTYTPIPRYVSKSLLKTTLTQEIGSYDNVTFEAHCLITQNNKASYKIYSLELTLLKLKPSVLRESNNQLFCQGVGSKIFLYKYKYLDYPLSLYINKANQVVVRWNDDRMIPMNDLSLFNMTHEYAVQCQYANYTYAPIAFRLNFEKRLHIIPHWPAYSRLTKHQVFGFQLMCQSDYHYNPGTAPNGLIFEWQLCQSNACLESQTRAYLNKQTTFNINKFQSLLTVISKINLRIIYWCCAVYDKKIISYKEFELNIIGNPYYQFRTPLYYFVPGSPVMCEAVNFDVSTYRFASVPVPTRLRVIQLGVVIAEIDTNETNQDPDFKMWTPRIVYPSQIPNLPTQINASCLQNSYTTGNLVEVASTSLDVALTYSFKYSRNFKSGAILPGTSYKCCLKASRGIFQSYNEQSLESSPDNNNSDNECLQAWVKLKDTYDNLLYEGFQPVIPQKVQGRSIYETHLSTYCSSGSLDKYQDDQDVTFTMLTVSDCSKSNQKLEIYPKYQTMFLVNESFYCLSTDQQCRYDYSSMIYEVLRDSQVINSAYHVESMILLDSYVGPSIELRCRMDDMTALVSSRIVSVEMAPINIEITGVNKIVEIRTIITCKSKGFPHPKIVWTQLKGTSMIYVEDDVLFIRDWDHNDNYEFECSAFNKHGEISEKISFMLVNVNIHEQYYSKWFYIIIGIIFFVFCVLLVLVVIFVYYPYLFDVSINK